jgi:hypothetical protein
VTDGRTTDRLNQSLTVLGFNGLATACFIVLYENALAELGLVLLLHGLDVLYLGSVVDIYQVLGAFINSASLAQDLGCETLKVCVADYRGLF